MARKKEKVAALLSMYCESVAKNPRGPGPALYRYCSAIGYKHRRNDCAPEDTI